MMSQRIPIRQDDLSFEERQGQIWTDMEKDMERRRKEWEDEIEGMRKDFFHLKPEDNKLTDRMGMPALAGDAFGSQDDAKSAIEQDQFGRPVFRARFNVKDYKPEEVNVKVDNDKLIVQAKHEEKGGSKSVSREFSREINIPREVDKMALGCTISSDGVLTAEAPMQTPGYQSITAPPSSGMRERIIPTMSANVASPPYSVPVSGKPIHTSTFSTFVSPVKSGAPAPPYPQSPISSSTISGVNSSPQSFSPQIYSNSNVSSSSSKFETRSDAGSPSTLDRDRKYKVEVDIEDFAPEDINVRTVDKKLVISARKEERVGTRTSTKELNREFNLPDTVDPQAVKAFFSETGKLLIEAPYIKCLPIGHEGSPMNGR